jgi:acetate---CoA ligase (ADP-forming)
LRPLDYFFYPGSIVIIGVTPGADENRFGGQYYLRSLMAAGYSGKTFAVGMLGGEYRGLKIFRHVTDIHDRIDYAIISVPAKAVPDVLTDCGIKHIPAVHIFSAGFGELGGIENKAREQRLLEIAREYGIRFIGPNCMGVYCPGTGLSFHDKFSTLSGGLSFISQSGSNAEYVVRMGMRRGTGFAKVVSYGNGTDIEAADLLEYLAGDPDTKVISIYVEGVRDGKRFLNALRAASRAKPVLVLKGGVSDSGCKAVLSHTAAVTGSVIVWKTVIKQSGAIAVSDTDEFIDIALLCQNSVPARGNRSAIVGIGGGFGVLISDIWSAAGLDIPQLSQETLNLLGKAFKISSGISFKNPIELFGWESLRALDEIVTILDCSGEVDHIMVHIPVGFVNAVMPKALDYGINGLLGLPANLKQDLVIVLHSAFTQEDAAQIIDLEAKLAGSGLSVFPSPQRAATALSKFTRRSC